GLSHEEDSEILKKLKAGSIDILIGTHSILQERVQFANLGLVTADEQQRFGVEQRRTLREKGTRVDFLLMSATPIPRTLASTLYGDMDISTIESMPPGRKTVKTVLIRENSFRSVLNDVRHLLAEGHQLYVICAAVEESLDYDARSAAETAANLKKLFAPDYRTALLHGRMTGQEKQNVMNEFAENRIQVLVSTTVVEVGMNVVNATGMIVYDADRFGISQLHQLRGRIQRGSIQGQCWLLTDSEDEKALKRLDVLTRTNNGFEISYEDLRLRGPGDILGTRQSGISDFVLGNLVEDTKIINQARKDAEIIIKNSDSEDFRAVMEEVARRNKHNASYAD
ncbi:MAG: ATP-dependent DNA helicase RecG, partial [Erysipelotrichia bacterium]|nr:ATP-dependent DNA helicase RecG [Erysipelotrichia bacterium]